jgi:transcriptional regulator with XRE-family HTH domain
MVAARLVGYRYDHGLSQRALAERSGVSQPRVVELESGEKNPQIETLVKISAATGLEFAIDVAPLGQEPKLVGKAVKDAPAHAYAGASVLVASRRSVGADRPRNRPRGRQSNTTAQEGSAESATSVLYIPDEIEPASGGTLRQGVAHDLVFAPARLSSGS